MKLKDNFKNINTCVCVLALLTSQQENKNNRRIIQQLFTLNYKVQDCGEEV